MLSDIAVQDRCLSFLGWHGVSSKIPNDFRQAAHVELKVTQLNQIGSRFFFTQNNSAGSTYYELFVPNEEGHIFWLIFFQQHPEILMKYFLIRCNCWFVYTDALYGLKFQIFVSDAMLANHKGIGCQRPKRENTTQRCKNSRTPGLCQRGLRLGQEKQ